MMLSSSWIAEKSVLNPFIALSVGLELLGGASEMDTPPPFIPANDGVSSPQALDVVLEEVIRGVGPEGEEEEEGAFIFPLSERGIMAAVSSRGMSFLRTFSAMRYMANANCSEFRRPVFSMSHRLLLVTHTHIYTHNVRMNLNLLYTEQTHTLHKQFSTINTFMVQDYQVIDDGDFYSTRV